MEQIPSRVALVGDMHGRTVPARGALRAAAAAGIKEVYFLGDWGFLWSTRGFNHELDSLEDTLDELDLRASVVGGNHENFDLWERHLWGGPEPVHVRPRTRLLPRVWRAETAAGTRVAALGGANSIDRHSRAEGGEYASWWAQESITSDQLADLGTSPVDVLLGHDCPRSKALLGALEPFANDWNPRGLAYAHEGHRMFQRGVEQVKPKLTVGGHYHLFLDTTEEFIGHDGLPFVCRAVTLNAEHRYPSLAIVDFDALQVEYVEVPN